MSRSIRVRASLLGVVAAVQLGFVGSLVWRSEATLESGRAYRFRTEPIDPVDLFRGRYVALRFPTTSLPQVEAPPFTEGDAAWARISGGADGFAEFISLHHQPPEDWDALEVEIVSANRTRTPVRPSFDRFYMDEDEAPALEARARATGGPTWVVIRVRNGRGVVEDIGFDPTARQLSTAELARGVLTPEGTTIPLALFDAALRRGPPTQRLAECGARVECVVFPVELDGAAGSEYVLQGPLLQYHYYAPVDDPGNAGQYVWRAVLRSQGRGAPLAGRRLLEALARGVRTRAAPHRDLLVGEHRLWIPR
jgi:hypothetical protein